MTIPSATYLDQIKAKYTGYERILGTQKVTTGAFAAETEEIKNGLRDVALGDSMNLDAFGRLRVSTPYTLFDGKLLRPLSGNNWSDVEASGTGTGSTYSANRASMAMSVSATTAGTRVRQSFRRFPYTPGKSQLSLVTFVHGELASGISRKIGLFDNQNGIFLSTSGTSIGLTRRSYVTGSAVDTTVQQAAWNIDPFDGTGPSGITLDLTLAQILVIDYEWLGVGRVRVGFNVDGVTYPAHQFLNANNLSSVYMSSPNLPLRYELENDGTGAAATLEAVCSTVISEGGEDPIGCQFGVASEATQTDLNGTGATRYVLMGLRVEAASEHKAVIDPSQFSIMGATFNDVFAWEIVLDGTVAGALSWSSSNGVAEYCYGTSANTITGGTILQTGVALSRSEIAINPRNIQGPGVAYDGTPQHLYFVIRPFSNMQAAAAINWVER